MRHDVSDMVITIEQRGPGPAYLSGMLPDETVSSWLDRNKEYVRATAESGPHPRGPGEYDFGELRLNLPAAPQALLAQLQAAALAPARRVFSPHKRVRFCEQCRIEDWAAGRPEYKRRSWCVSWCTCCAQHGSLILPGKPSLASALGYSSVFTRSVFASSPITSTRGMLLGIEKWFHTSHLSIFNDRRATHLEQALCYQGGSARPAWWPRGFSPNKLFAAYIAILKALLPWEIPKEAGTEATMETFENLNFGERYTAHVFAEAILSSWSHTPLPRAAGPAMRTELLLRLLGWSITPPKAPRPNQLLLLIECPVLLADDARRNCAKYFDKGVQASAKHSTARISAFNKVEAQALGLDTRDIQVVTALVDAGRLGRFDSKRWVLRHAPNIVPLSPVELNVLNRSSISMPKWFREQGHGTMGSSCHSIQPRFRKINKKREH